MAPLARTRRRDALIGTVLQGRYRVEEAIGKGGMGTVYRAVQVPFERHVAVKVLASEHCKDPDLVRRFAAEALIIGRLRHPHTLKPYDFGRTEDGRLYIVTEHLEGRTLAALLRGGPLDARLALGYLGQVCDALAEAHAKGIIHRDLKPANIFVERVGKRDVVKVLDFGVAKLVGGAAGDGDTEVGKIHGTPAYMSPEQAEGQELDARSDLYALGVIAYQCLTGRAPFDGPTPASILLQHVQAPPPPLREAVPGRRFRPDVEGLVLSLLEKDPRRRPYTADDVRTQIDQILHGAPHARPSSPDSPALPAATPDPLAATFHAGPDQAAALMTRTRLGPVAWLRAWLSRSRAARWLAFIALIEVAAAVGLGFWFESRRPAPQAPLVGPPVEAKGQSQP